MFASYAEIPAHVAEYILNVVEERDIKRVSLSDINSFLEGLNEFVRTTQTELTD